MQKKKNPLSTFPLCDRSEMPIHKHSMMLTYSRAKRRLEVLDKYDKYNHRRKLVSPTLLCKKGFSIAFFTSPFGKVGHGNRRQQVI